VTRGIVVVSVVLLAVVGGVAVAITQGSPSSGSAPRDAVALTSSARHQFTDLEELVGASDLVVIGRVIADEDGRTFGNPSGSGSRAPSAIRSHVLTLRVERVLAGAVESTDATNTNNTNNTEMVVLVEEEYSLGDGTPVRVDGMRRGRVGDRGAWFLAAGTDPDFPAYALVNAQGRYLFGGRTLRGGDRTDMLVRSVERMSPTRLQDAVVAAATSISR
jgi:hypothetical protein